MLSATQPTVEHALYRLAFEALRRRIHIYNPTIVSASTLEHPYHKMENGKKYNDKD
jgi:hypothetical protein